MRSALHILELLLLLFAILLCCRIQRTMTPADQPGARPCACMPLT
jgi:hypothetical protein